MKNVHKKAQELLLRYKTGDPWKLAEYLGIVVFQMPFKKVRGMFCSVEGQKFIFINSNLNDKQRHHTLLHEIAHALLHPEQNYFAITERNEVETYLNLNMRPKFLPTSSLNTSNETNSREKLPA